MGSCLSFSAQNRQKPAWPASPRARRPHPGRNLGLGRQNAAARSPAWAKLRSGHLQPFDQDRRLVRASREIKTRRGQCTENPRVISLPPLLSLRSLFSAEHNRASESERRRPWHRHRPPRRRARSSAGERAAVERPGRGDPFAEPGSVFFSHAGEGPARLFFSLAGEGTSRRTAR